MNGNFESVGPVWLDPRPLAADDDLSAFTKEELALIYNLEMDRRCAAGVPRDEARHLTSTWDAKNKAAHVAKLVELRADGTTPHLLSPHRLNELSRPTLAAGTLLVHIHGRSHDDRTYATVVGTTAAGRVKLSVRANETLEFAPVPVGVQGTVRRRCAVGSRAAAAFTGATELAVFEPCARPGDVNAHVYGGDNNYWSLRSGRNHVAFVKMWHAADADAAAAAAAPDGAVVWTAHLGDGLD